MRRYALEIWAAVALLAIVIGFQVSSTLSLVDNTKWVDHTHRVIESLDEIATSIAQATSARHAYASTGDAAQLDAYARATRKLGDAEARVRMLTSDNPRQQQRLDALEPLLAKAGARLDDVVASERVSELEQIQHLIDELDAEERHLLVAREQHTQKSIVLTEALELLAAIAGVAAVGIAIVRLRREVRRREVSELALRENEQALERRVEKRTAELVLANRELESFSYSVVHDLRAPLRAMSGFAELLIDPSTDALSVDARDYLQEIKQNARTMATLIDALVAMSHITRDEIVPAEVDLTELARSVARELALTESRSPLEVVVAANLRATTDPRLARKLLEILIGNAWKFADKTASRVEVGTTDIDGERVLFVRDNGAGFDMAHVAKLFSPFGRLHTTAEFPGIGIGLATAQRIIQRHGGRIWADAHVHEGAVFYFTLPA